MLRSQVSLGFIPIKFGSGGRIFWRLPDLFSDRRKRVEKDRDELEAELYRQVGQLKVELDWLKKKLQLLH